MLAPRPIRKKTDPKIRGPGEQLQLFPNEIPAGQFAIAAPLADRIKALTDDITEETARADYQRTSRDGRGLIFRGRRRRQDWALAHTGRGIDNAEQAYHEIERLRSPQVVKGVLTLWNCATEMGTFQYRGTRLHDIMRAGGYQPTSTGYYSQDQKREFTDVLYTLQNWRFFIDKDTQDTDDTGRPQDMTMRHFYSILEIERATYAKRRDGTTDDSVIVRLWAELLPRLNKGIQRGRLYAKDLLKLDAGRDGAAMLLGFKLSTRIDQLRQGNRPEPITITYDLAELVRLAGRADNYPNLVERKRKHKIRLALKRDLDKLIAVGVIARYEPKELPREDWEKVTIYAVSLALPAPEPAPGLPAPGPEAKPEEQGPGPAVLEAGNAT